MNKNVLVISLLECCDLSPYYLDLYYDNEWQCCLVFNDLAEALDAKKAWGEFLNEVN